MGRKEMLPYALSVPEAAKYMNVSAHTVRALLKKGILKYSEPLRGLQDVPLDKSRKLIRTEDIEKLIDDKIVETVNVEEVKI